MYLDGIYVFDKKAKLPDDAKTETFTDDWYLILFVCMYKNKIKRYLNCNLNLIKKKIKTLSTQIFSCTNNLNQRIHIIRFNSISTFTYNFSFVFSNFRKYYYVKIYVLHLKLAALLIILFTCLKAFKSVWWFYERLSSSRIKTLFSPSTLLYIFRTPSMLSSILSCSPLTINIFTF